jgi:hypothetical protein
MRRFWTDGRQPFHNRAQLKDGLDANAIIDG